MTAGLARAVEPDRVVDVQDDPSAPRGEPFESERREEVHLPLDQRHLPVGVLPQHAAQTGPSPDGDVDPRNRPSVVEATILFFGEEGEVSDRDAVPAQLGTWNPGSDPERRRGWPKRAERSYR